MLRATFIALICLLCLLGQVEAADIKPAESAAIPDSGKRPTVVRLTPEQVDKIKRSKVAAEISTGFKIEVAAESPLVTHPIMGCVDDRGRLFVGDAVGVNWNKAQLDANPPNRIIMLEDTDGDGIYDQSTVFAEGLTFPQGACWHNGSLYVCSPPSLWKLTDTTGNGVADKREVLVTGFEYTGNAADTHGPKMHPNGRLYWCHGRKGHKVVGKDGVIVHEGLASGIWSCKPDGTDVQWHALGCADNPTGLAITPQGDLLGTVNLYYNGPRGDTLMHWLDGGVYERGDVMNAITGLPRTLDKMPIIHNFGHVAVSGCSLWQPGEGVIDLFVTHFNTQRLVRMELTPSGSSYLATENEFLKLHENDTHLTDVFEDGRGGLMLVNTGGWFRSGCPSSLTARPDVLGSIYRITRNSPLPPVGNLRWRAPLADDILTADPVRQLRALGGIARAGEATDEQCARIRALLGGALDAPLEHAVIRAAQKLGARVLNEGDLVQAKSPAEIRRMLMSVATDMPARAQVALRNLASEDAALAATATQIAGEPAQQAAALGEIGRWLDAPSVTPSQLAATGRLLQRLITDPAGQAMATRMLRHSDATIRDNALGLLDRKSGAATPNEWVTEILGRLHEGDLSLRLETIRKIKDARFDPELRQISGDKQVAMILRLKALDAMKGLKLDSETFDLLLTTLTEAGSSAAARIKAASMLAAFTPEAAQVDKLADAVSNVGPIELRELVPLGRRIKPASAGRFAGALAKNPAIISIQESVFRTAFSAHAPEVLEKELLPARRQAEKQLDARKREIGPLADKAAAAGRPQAGRELFAAGKGSCIACHQIGAVGRSIGPNLSHIGGIRVERDLVESVLFPSNTLARDYETHQLETTDGQTVLGVIRSHTAEGLLVVDVGGQEHNIPNHHIIADTLLPTSLMPMGLDQTLAPQEFSDLIAYLRSLK
jgi:putative heme-binding domain-containing protein